MKYVFCFSCKGIGISGESIGYCSWGGAWIGAGGCEVPGGGSGWAPGGGLGMFSVGGFGLGF